MRVEKVKVFNFRGIEEKEIELKPGFNLIIGENGKGKTTTLEAIAIGLGGFISGMNPGAVRKISTQEVRRTYPVLGDGSVDEKLNVPVKIEMDAMVNEEGYNWARIRKSPKLDSTVTTPLDIQKTAEDMLQKESTELPVLLYESTERSWGKESKGISVNSSKNYYRAEGYDEALTGISNKKLLLDWCVKMELVSWQKEKKIAEYEAVKNAVALFMHEMEQKGDYEILYDKQTGKLMFQNDGKSCPVEDLSSGYQSLVWIAFDIAYRMAVLNPDKKEKIAETAGVVLIDEIDMHLHPKWQWNIIDALCTVFPNVQFIAATHSPILFSSAKNVWIVDMGKDEIRYSCSQYGLDVNRTLVSYQETEGVYPKVQEQILLFYQMIDNGNLSEAEAVLRKLETDTGAENPIITELRTTLDLEKMELGE